MTKADRIYQIAQSIAYATDDFHITKGPGKGDRATHSFMAELRDQVEACLGEDYSEKQISGGIKSAVDFFIPDEATIVEVAMSLKVPMSEFHKDIFKALLTIDNGIDVKRILFICKPGGLKRHQEPASVAIMKWLKKYYSVEIEIKELD